MGNDIDISDFLPGEPTDCRLIEAIEYLDAKDKQRFLAACDHPGVTTNRLYKWLLDRGVRVGLKSISSHRKHECRCVQDG